MKKKRVPTNPAIKATPVKPLKPATDLPKLFATCPTCGRGTITDIAMALLAPVAASKMFYGNPEKQYPSGKLEHKAPRKARTRKAGNSK